MFEKGPDTIRFEEENKFPTMQRLLQPQNADSQTTSSLVICEIYYSTVRCPSSRVIINSSFAQVVRHGEIAGMSR